MTLTEVRFTPREKEILDLVAAGLTNPQIAERLYVSRRTVDQHLHTMRTKARVTTRTALLRYHHGIGDQDRATALNDAADETDDSYDHDELHAAADVVRAGLSTRYIDRWVAGLEHRHGITTEGFRP